MKTLPPHTAVDLEEAAEFLGISTDAAQRMARTGIIKGRRVGPAGGKAWRFLSDNLIAYLNAGESCVGSTKEVRRTTSTYHTAAGELDALLGQPTSGPRNVLPIRSTRSSRGSE